MDERPWLVSICFEEQFRRLKPGARFFISEIKAKGPDGITRDISPMEVALN